MRIVKFLLYGLFPCLLWSCEKEGTDQQYVEVPEGFALSAGTATNFLTSSKAYDFEASWLSGIYSSRFNDGDGLYDDVRTSSNQDGGLGSRVCRLFLWKLSPQCRTYQAYLVE